jgi:hypothetical protein
MKIGRITKIIGSGAIGGVTILILYLTISFTIHAIFWPEGRLVVHVGWVQFVIAYTSIMGTGFFDGIVVSALRLRPPYGAIAAALSGAMLTTMLYTIWFLYYWPLIPVAYIWWYALGVVQYGIMSAIVGAACGFLNPRKEVLLFRDPPAPDHFNFDQVREDT